MQPRLLKLDFSVQAAFRLSKMLKEHAEFLNMTDENGDYRQSDSEFCLVWSQAFELLAQAQIARMHVVNVPN